MDCKCILPKTDLRKSISLPTYNQNSGRRPFGKSWQLGAKRTVSLNEASFSNVCRFKYLLKCALNCMILNGLHCENTRSQVHDSSMMDSAMVQDPFQTNWNCRDLCYGGRSKGLGWNQQIGRHVQSDTLRLH